jgi:hypothetical protein
MGELANMSARIHLREASVATQQRPPRRQRRMGALICHAKMVLGSAQPGQNRSTHALGAKEELGDRTEAQVARTTGPCLP